MLYIFIICVVRDCGLYLLRITKYLGPILVCIRESIRTRTETVPIKSETLNQSSSASRIFGVPASD